MAAHRSAAVAERRQRALDLRIAGVRYRQIAKELGISHQLAFHDVQVSLGELAKLSGQKAEKVRELEVERCDKLSMAMWPKAKAGDHKAAQAILHAMERRARLLGLDAPERVLHAGMVITGEQLAGSRDSLAEKLEGLRQRMLGEGQGVVDVTPAQPASAQLSAARTDT